MEQLSLIFGNSPAPNSMVTAEHMNALITKVNELVIASNATESLLQRISKSEIIVLASKSTQLNFAGNGQSVVISGWLAKLNKDSIFNATTGVTTFKDKATYTIVSKTLVSADNAISPRSKLSIFGASNELGLSEDNVFSSLNSNISNYRITHSADATSEINPTQTAQINIAVWGATTARIFADMNTMLWIYKEIG